MIEERGTVNSVITGRDRDCFSCKMTSGCGLLGLGAYLVYESRTVQRVSRKSLMYLTASAFFYLGTARLLDIPPFRGQFSHNDVVGST